jgi:serine/threonine protein kinase
VVDILDEARVLAQIQHPYVVRVKRYFRAHGTAYIVMDYEEGEPLSAVLQDGETLDEEEVRGLLEDVLPALQAVHEQGYLHRDIKPANLYLRASDHRVILIDFGAARQTLASDQPMLKPMYTPGFASPEHYGSRKDLGPWSDIYSVGASMYACLAGCAPQAADDRIKKDSLTPAMVRWDGQYSDRLLEIIDWCLNLNHLYRPQSVFALQKALVEEITPPTERKTPGWLNRVVGKIKGAAKR